MRIPAVILLAGVAVCLNGCGKRDPGVTVGSKFGTEQAVLGEILAQHLERRLGHPVIRRLGSGDTDSLQQALTSGEIDLYPEYTGTALRNVLKLNMEHDAATVYERVRDLYLAQYQLECLPPFGFDGAVLAAVSQAMAEEHNLRKMSDLEGSGLAWKIAYTGSFGARPDGLPTMIEGYKPSTQSGPLMLDPAALFRALESKTANLIVVRATDGQVGALKAALLPDDRLVFPPYQGFVAVRSKTLAAQPKLRAALTELSGRIDTPAMQKMNAEVDLGRKSPADVARAFLERSGLAR